MTSLHATDDPQAVRDLPTGTVTLLFTDIEGSTRLLADLGDRYASLLAEHREMVRTALRSHGGVEVDTQGDGFFYAFASAKQAAAGARDAQHALAEGDVHVRIGLHTGEPTVTDEGYVGMDVHRAARIMAAGHGGQVLLSRSTRDLLDDDADLRDLGEHRLKDLTAPQRLWQLGKGEFPPLKTLYQSNLPVQGTPLIGREGELAEAGALLREHRLLTLTGPGGSGKTRLGLQLAADAAEDFPDGVWWVSLASIGDPALVLPTVAHVLGSAGDLIASLRTKRLLLVLDNLEQVIESAAALAALLAGTTGVTLLVTSRELLRIDGEREYPVEPMAEDEAALLFAQRAVNAEPRNAVVQICRRLDCLPLAVELAAARTALLPPIELLARLDRRLALLTGGRRDAPARQRTLRATIEWSHELLSMQEQALFRSLAVFSGGFTMEAAEAVARADLDTLGSLVDKSLVRRWPSGRFGMFETLAEFAREQLEVDPSADERHESHATYFVSLAERFVPELRGPRQPELLADLEAEHANLREVLAWSLGGGRPEIALRLCAALADFWILHSHLGEGRRWISETLAAVDPAETSLDAGRAGALYAASVLATQQADWNAAEATSRERLEIARRMGDMRQMSGALLTLGRADLALGDADAARTHLEEAIERAQKTNEPFFEAMATFNLAYVALSSRAFGRARELMLAALDLFEAMPDPYGVARAYTGLGAIAVHGGDLTDALQPLREGLTRSLALTVSEGVTWALELMGCALSVTDPDAAARILGAAESQRIELGMKLEDAELAAHQRAVANQRAALDAAALDAAWAGGGRQTLAEAVAFAIAGADTVRQGNADPSP